MNLFDKENYNIEDIQNLIEIGAEENLHLEFKDGKALDFSEKEKIQISKDSSAFANSDGGIIIYGISESKENHKASCLSPVDSKVITKEWLENIISSRTERIFFFVIYSIPISEDSTQVIYLVKIPKSANAPHMCCDKKFYKRYNFKAQPMDEYEVRELYSRIIVPDLSLANFELVNSRAKDNSVRYEFHVAISNTGNTIGKYYKINIIFKTTGKRDYSLHPAQNINFSAFPLKDNIYKVSIPSKEFIFPHELLDTGSIVIRVTENEYGEFLHDVVILIQLYYEGGLKEYAYIPWGQQKIFSDRDDIDTIKQCHGFYSVLE